MLRADVDGVVQPGVARAPAVRWNKRAEDAVNVNVLTSERLTDMGGGPILQLPGASRTLRGLVNTAETSEP